MERRALSKLAERTGIMVMDCGNALHADAPPGYVIANTGTHSTMLAPLDAWKRSDAYDDIARDIEDGCLPCDDEDCDTCAEGMTFDELLTLYRGTRI